MFALISALVVKLNVVEVAPTIGVNVVPPFRLTIHCTVGAGWPVAAAVKVARFPTPTDIFAGFAVITGVELTVSVAAVDVLLLTEFVNTASYALPFCEAVVVMLKVVEVAPATAAKLAPPFVLNSHCTVGAGVPMAAAVKVAIAPAITVVLPGCAVIVGAVLVLTVPDAAQPPIHTPAANVRILSNIRAADAASPRNWKFCLKF
jgi:hypothetical protein